MFKSKPIGHDENEIDAATLGWAWEPTETEEYLVAASYQNI